MKPSLALGAALLLSAGIVRAQSGLSISIKGGPQLSDLHASNLRADKRLAYTAGIGAAYGLSPALSFGLDVMYSSEGRRIVFSSASGPEELDFRERIGYLKLPAYAACTLRPDKTLSFTARLGPQFSFLLHSEGVDGSSHSVMFRSTKPAYTDLYIGAMAGVDVNLRLASQVRLSLGLRADMSFTDTEKESIYLPALNDGFTSSRNYGAWLGLHYHFSPAKARHSSVTAGQG